MDDSDDGFVEETLRVVADVPTATLLPNVRSRGASGAWNTGLSWLLSQAEDPSAHFVAILDDDDEWAPAHLELCCEAAVTSKLDR